MLASGASGSLGLWAVAPSSLGVCPWVVPLGSAPSRASQSPSSRAAPPVACASRLTPRASLPAPTAASSQQPAPSTQRCQRCSAATGSSPHPLHRTQRSVLCMRVQQASHPHSATTFQQSFHLPHLDAPIARLSHPRHPSSTLAPDANTARHPAAAAPPPHTTRDLCSPPCFSRSPRLTTRSGSHRHRVIVLSVGPAPPRPATTAPASAAPTHTLVDTFPSAHRWKIVDV